MPRKKNQETASESNTALAEQLEEGMSAQPAGEDTGDAAIESELESTDTQQWESDQWAEAQFKSVFGDTTPTEDNREHQERYADWYANTLLSLDAEEDRVKLQLEVRLRQIDARRKSLELRHAQKVERIARLLLANSTKKKSIDLESGRLGFRAQPEKVEFADEDVVQRFAEAYVPAAEVYSEETVIKRKVDRKALLAAVKQYASEHTGDLPAGMLLAGGDERFYVKKP